VREAGALFAALWRERQSVDQRVLRALAAESDLEPTAAEALQKYRLGPKSTVSSALPRLVEHEVLSRTDEGRYGFDDPFFRRWVQLNTLGDLGLPVPPLRRT
jgi:DNA-binding transcriptional ArsR family regulator